MNGSSCRAGLLLTLPASLLAASSAPLATPQELPARIDALLAPLYPAGEPGAVVLVARAGEVVFRRAYGLADLENGVAMTPEAAFKLASVSKVFTATAVLALVEKGALDLEGTLGDSGLEVPAAWRGIRLVDLLAHASGLPECLDRPDARAWIRAEHTLPELLASFADRPLAFRPGQKNAYSNSNYSVLAAWLERASGKNWPACMEELVFRPTGLTATRCGVDLALVPHRARGYAHEDDGTFRNETPYSFSNLRGSGDLVSTADDVHRFLVALTKGELLSPETLARSFVPAKLVSGRPGTYALGWELERLRGQPVVLKGGAISGFCHYVALLPERRDWVVLLTNRGPEDAHRPGRLALGLLELLLDG